jgi:hypothetical protein
MSSGGGGTTSTSSVQNASPWSAQQPYLRDVFREAQRLYFGANPQTVNGMQFPDPNAGPQYFPGSTVAPLAPETGQALQLETQRALAGSPLLTAAQDETSKTLAGTYLSAGNPYLSQLVQGLDNTIRPQVDSRFIGSGRYGSPAYAAATASALANAVAPYAFQNYSTERANMERAATAAPDLANQDYTNIAALADVGAQRQAQSQGQLTDQVNRWNFNQNADAARLAQYLQMIQGNYGGTTTSSQNVAQQPSGPTWLSAFSGLLGGSRGLLGF